MYGYTEGGNMKSKIKLLLDFAKGEGPTNEKMKIYSVIDGKKKLMDEFSTDAPVSVMIKGSSLFGIMGAAYCRSPFQKEDTV